MVVIVIIGILATLGYSSLSEVIFTSRAKETAQTIRTFTEKALMDSKRLNKEVKIYIDGNEIKADTTVGETTNYVKMSSEALSQGFSPSSPPDPLPVPSITKNFNSGIKSKIRIGLSGIDEAGYFAVCGFKDYCGGAVKLDSINSFKAYIRKGSGKPWEAL